MDMLPATNTSTRNYPTGVLYVSGTSCLLSAVGALVIFWSYAKLPPIRSFTWKLIVCLTAADLVSALGYFISVIRYAHDGDVDNDATGERMCKAQAIVTTYSSLVSFFLTISIAVHVCSTVFQRNGGLITPWNEPNQKWLLAANVVSWSVPGVILIIAESYDVLGEDATKVGATGPWCWVDTSTSRPWMWQIVAGKGWEILTYIVTSGLWVLLKYKLYRSQNRMYQENYTAMRQENRNFLYVWLILYVIRFWGTLRFFLSVADPKLTESNRLMMVLLYLQAFGDPAQASCNCILYCALDKAVRQKLAGRCCDRCRSQSENERLLTSPL